MKNKNNQENKIVLLPKFVVRRPTYDYDLSGLDIKPALNDRIFREAIYIASPALYEELIKYKKGELSEKENRKMEKTLLKYLSRISYRCTPFGMFAICGIGSYGKNTVLYPDRSYFAHSVPFDFLEHLSAGVISKCEDEEFGRITVQKNQTISRNYDCRGKKRRIAAVVRDEKHRWRQAFFPLTSILKSVVSLTEKPITIAELKRALNEKYEISNEQLTAYIRNLLAKDLLFSNLDPGITTNNSLERWLETTSKILTNPKQKLHLALSINQKLKELDAVSIEFFESKNRENGSDSIVSFKEVKDSAKEYFPSMKIDVNSYGSGFFLPDAVKKLVGKIFSLFWRLCARTSDHLTSFRNNFSRRYENEEIALLDIFDENRGLDRDIEIFDESFFQKAAMKDKAHRENVGRMNVSLTRFEQIVLSKLTNGSNHCRNILSLSDNDFEDTKPVVEIDSLSCRSLPLSFGAIFSVVGHDGEQPILSDFRFASQSGASLLTRFASQNEDIANMVKWVVQQEKETFPEHIILAEIDHLSETKIGAIQSRPVLREFSIPYATFGSGDSKREIDLADLFVSVREGRVVLRSKRLSREVIPCFTSAFNPYFNTSPLYKFLFEIHLQNNVNYLCLSTEGLSILFPHLPRITYGNVVLAPETWKVNVSEFRTGKGKISMLSVSKFKEWHSKTEAPRHLQFSRKDNFLIVDIDSDLSIEALLDEIRNDDKIILSEFLPLASDMNHFESVAEIIQPLIIRK